MEGVAVVTNRILLEILKELFKIRRLLEIHERMEISESNTNRHIDSVWNKALSDEFDCLYSTKYKRKV